MCQLSRLIMSGLIMFYLKRALWHHSLKSIYESIKWSWFSALLFRISKISIVKTNQMFSFLVVANSLIKAAHLI